MRKKILKINLLLTSRRYLTFIIIPGLRVFFQKWSLIAVQSYLRSLEEYTIVLEFDLGSP